MSYIRSTSNPESLYIWGDLDNNAYVVMGPETIGKMPTHVLNGLIRKYHRNYCEDTKYKGAEIKETCIDGKFKMQLSYKEWQCVMWRVTWDYIAFTNNKRDIKIKNRNKCAYCGASYPAEQVGCYCDGEEH
jgi:hypothetical protein